MVYYWNKNQQIAKAFLEGKRVLELGSGTGIVGISAALFDPSAVFLTDLPEYIKILEINQQKNTHLSSDANCIQVRKLEWDNK
jgi:predicted RNA methylase